MCQATIHSFNLLVASTDLSCLPTMGLVLSTGGMEINQIRILHRKSPRRGRVSDMYTSYHMVIIIVLGVVCSFILSTLLPYEGGAMLTLILQVRKVRYKSLVTCPRSQSARGRGRKENQAV